ncbi:MAG TPA: hypothetical protein VHH73_08945 [Verrucomicrobiae bacterium]|nr:hypothetical protein [Verrucomicrobiae bacterium]
MQKAIRADRVMTLRQTVVGHRPDSGAIGFEAGVKGQILLFPKSLRPFEGRRVIGIKYDLLKDEPARPHSARSSKRCVPGEPKASSPKTARRRANPEIVHFPNPGQTGEDGRNTRKIDELKAKVRRAIDELAAGKQVAAREILQSILKK